MGAPPENKPGAPVVGFNHNMKHQGRTFHIQTEDSGPQHAHIITHVFLGGNILASTKQSYDGLLPPESPSALFAAVRKRMEEQHKAMMRSLIRGHLDEEIARRTGAHVYAPGVLADGAQAPGLLIGGEASGPPTQPAPPPTQPASDRPRASDLPPPPLAEISPAPPTRTPRDLTGPRDAAGQRLDELILAYLTAPSDPSRR